MSLVDLTNHRIKEQSKFGGTSKDHLVQASMANRAFMRYVTSWSSKPQMIRTLLCSSGGCFSDCSHCKILLSYVEVKALPVQFVPSALCFLHAAHCEERASILFVATGILWLSSPRAFSPFLHGEKANPSLSLRFLITDLAHTEANSEIGSSWSCLLQN